MKKILGQHLNWENPDLLKQALTHRSVSKWNNERLEFLGDSLLGLVVTEWLYNTFPQLSEGNLTRLRSQLVNGKLLAEVARHYNLGEFICLGEGEIKSGGADKSSVLADAVEAIIGAYYMDQGYFSSKKFVLDVMQPWFEQVDPTVINKDAKSRLQERLQKQGFELPHYEVIHAIEEADNTEFHVSCCVAELNLITQATEKSRKKAEQEAARAMLDQLTTTGIKS
ncbi:ribonuclease III [Marinicella sp. W31]|uniref:ribonuclease III n=1 Tax=Marinicella sp. W31 TaxID=3023713 RepID=UPI0037579F6C